MEVLSPVDSNVCYGAKVPRSKLAACQLVFHGRECTHKEAENTAPVVGERFFGVRDYDGSVESKLAELFSIVEAMKKDREEDKKKLEEHELFKQSHELFKQSQDWMNAFSALGTTPEMLVASKVGRVQEKAQKEFRKMVQYVKMQTALQPKSAVSTAFKELTSDFNVKLTNVEEFCQQICVRAEKDKEWGTECARELADFMYKKTMEPIGAEAVRMSEWAWYGHMLMERHKGGHPDALQRSDSEARLVEVDKLYSRLQVEAAPTGFPDPCIHKFRNLVSMAPPSVHSAAESEISLLPVNFYFYGEAGNLADTFQTTRRSYRRIFDLSEADLVVLRIDDACNVKRLLFECLAYGLKTALVIVHGQALFDYVKRLSGRNRLSVTITSPGEAGMEDRLDSLPLANRPSNDLLAALVVSQVVHISDKSVKVVGRVNAGRLTSKLTLTTDKSPVIMSDEDVRNHGLKIQKLEVLHHGCKAIPGAVVSVVLEGNNVADIRRGTVIRDFRYGVPSFFRDVKAEVTTVEDVAQGSYTCLCRTMEYEVEVQVIARLRKDTKESVPASKLGKNQAGVISMTCKEEMYVEGMKKGAVWNSYGFSRFLLKKEGRAVLAGIVLPTEEKVGGSKR